MNDPHSLSIEKNRVTQSMYVYEKMKKIRCPSVHTNGGYECMGKERDWESDLRS